MFLSALYAALPPPQALTQRGCVWHSFVLAVLLRSAFRIDFCTATCIWMCHPQDGGKGFHLSLACPSLIFHSGAWSASKICTAQMEALEQRPNLLLGTFFLK